MQLVALTPGTTVLIIAPDYSLASISWDLQHQLIRHFDLETVRDNSKDRILELSNGSIIRVASVSRVDSAVGRSYDLIIFDEAAINNDGKRAFNIQLRPTLDKPQSKCIFISTPRGDNWFKEFFDRGFDGKPGWLSIHADYRENDRASQQDIDNARRELSHAEFEQEYLANFVTFEGQIWAFKNECILDLRHLREEVLSAPHRYDIIAGLDLGFRDPTAFCVILVLPNSSGQNEYYILEEHFEAARGTDRHAEIIFDMLQKYEIDYVFADSAAAQSRYDLAAIYDIPTIGAIKSRNDGIGAVGAVVDHDRLFIHDECVESIYAVRNYRWKGDVNEGVWNIEQQKPQHDRASHMADAIRYAIYSYEQTMGGILG